MACIANATTEPEEHDVIEITPRMIEAGVSALVAYSPYFHLEEDGAKSIYLAMVRAKMKEERDAS